jgi:hypothetical protein
MRCSCYHYQGAVVAGFGVLVSAAIAGEALTPTLLLSALMVAGGIGLTTRR